MIPVTGPLPGVSVIVPAYNSERTLEPLLQSLFALDYPADRLELVLVNNGSTDGTAAILARFANRITLLNEPKRGRSAARNRGIHTARYDLIAFTDADCLLHSRWLLNLLAPLDNPKVGISGGRIQAKEPCSAIGKFGETIHDHERAINYYRPPYAATANWASPKQVLLQTGGFDERLPRSEDVDLAYRIVQSGYRIVYCDDALVFHRHRDNWQGLFKEGFQHGFHSIRLLRKHYDFLEDAGYRRFIPECYQKLGANLIRLCRGGADTVMRYETVFDLGKRAGKIAGSIRFGSVHL